MISCSEIEREERKEREKRRDTSTCWTAAGGTGFLQKTGRLGVHLKAGAGTTRFCTMKIGILGPATSQNLVVKFDGEICGGVLVENASDDFPSKKKSKIFFQTSPEIRHQFRRKLRQLHSGNRWCLAFQRKSVAAARKAKNHKLHPPWAKRSAL